MSQASSTVATMASSAFSAVAFFAAQATAELPQHPLDDTKDYVWSMWDKTQLRKYLVQKGVTGNQTAAGKKRDELITFLDIQMLKVAYGKYGVIATRHSLPVTYHKQREWLASHNLIDNRSPIEKSRDEYLDLEVYNHSQRVWDTWSESDMKAWLVELDGIIKSDAEVKKEKMRKLIQDNYVHSQSKLNSAWTESQMRS
ncbi:hypothetical protein DFJ43DRAFT_1156859 [Lentinula guzmanii]|uniref:Uncharacterized protein n=1 Tax=Lentinula guzmanii TaxID=2804957 RepID=A0AA38JGB2_9AGAR|nr:hypothetical protein DFJ43DRAFT_1156859 [Lentinula guzmanii]